MPDWTNMDWYSYQKTILTASKKDFTNYRFVVKSAKEQDLLVAIKWFGMIELKAIEIRGLHEGLERAYYQEFGGAENGDLILEHPMNVTELTLFSGIKPGEKWKYGWREGACKCCSLDFDVKADEYENLEEQCQADGCSYELYGEYDKVSMTVPTIVGYFTH